MQKLLLIIILALIAVGAQAKKTEDDIDHLALASLLLSDNHFIRAKATLDEANQEEKDFDFARFHTLLGLAHKGLGDLPAARINFRDAVKAGETDPSLHVYLAQIAYELQDYTDAIAEIDLSGPLLEQAPALWAMKAQSYWLLKKPKSAWSTLNKAQIKFPEDLRFLRRKTFYLMDLGLYQEAAESGKQFLEQSAGSPEDYMAIGNALRVSKQYPQALIFLEKAHALYPDHAKITQVLAHTYLDQGHTSTAAELMTKASLFDEKLRVEAAELYRRADRLHQALNLNAQIQDENEKLKQRLAIYLKQQRFDMMLNMEDELYRSELLKDEDIRYAMAYASFKNADFERMERHLQKITRGDLFRKAIELRKAAEACRENPWQCLG